MTKVLNQKTAYQGKVLSIREVKLEFPHAINKTFELVDFQVETGVTALPIHEDKLLLISHFQTGIGKDGICLPSGGLNKGEDPEYRMQLELQEEIGYKAGSLELMTRLDLLPSYIGSKSGYLYLARDLHPSRLTGDEQYPIKLLPTTVSESLKLINNQTIRDVRTITAILMYKELYLR
jgi:ADP-ribose diphosphatase